MRTRLITQPRPGEGHDDFLSRCEAAGGGRQECENLWNAAQGILRPAAAGRQGHFPCGLIWRCARSSNDVRSFAPAGDVLQRKTWSDPSGGDRATWPTMPGQRIIRRRRHADNDSDLWTMMQMIVLLPSSRRIGGLARCSVSAPRSTCRRVTSRMPFVGNHRCAAVPLSLKAEHARSCNDRLARPRSARRKSILMSRR